LSFFQLDGLPRLKLSQDIEKVTIPCRKNLYRLFGRDGKALCDLMTEVDEPQPVANVRILCQHAFLEKKRAYVTPSSVRCMYNLYWADGQVKYKLPTWEEARTYAREQIQSLRKDHRRYLNPTPYKVSVTERLFSFMHNLWMQNVPIGELA
jgi:nicotinate phosphoribosyltransferase